MGDNSKYKDIFGSYVSLFPDAAISHCERVMRFARFAPSISYDQNHIQQTIGDNMCHEDKKSEENRAYYAVLEMKDGKYIVHSNVREPGAGSYMGMHKSYDYQEAINFIKKHLSSSNCYVVKVMAEVKREVEHYS